MLPSTSRTQTIVARLTQSATLLSNWHFDFKTMILSFLLYGTSEARGRPLYYQEQLAEVVSDPDILPLLEGQPLFLPLESNWVSIKRARQELEDLISSNILFGQYNNTTSFDNINLPYVYTKLQTLERITLRHLAQEYKTGYNWLDQLKLIYINIRGDYYFLINQISLYIPLVDAKLADKLDIKGRLSAQSDGSNSSIKSLSTWYWARPIFC